MVSSWVGFGLYSNNNFASFCLWLILDFILKKWEKNIDVILKEYKELSKITEEQEAEHTKLREKSNCKLCQNINWTLKKVYYQNTNRNKEFLGKFCTSSQEDVNFKIWCEH